MKDKLNDIAKQFKNSRELYSKKRVRVLHYIAFYIPIVLILIIGVYSTIVYLDVKNIDTKSFFMILISKFSLIIPLLFVSWYSNKRLEENKKMAEEYQHKINLIKTYSILEEGKGEDGKENEKNKELIEKIRKKLIKTINYNTAQSLFDSNDSMISLPSTASLALKANKAEIKIGHLNEKIKKLRKKKKRLKEEDK